MTTQQNDLDIFLFLKYQDHLKKSAVYAIYTVSKHHHYVESFRNALFLWHIQHFSLG